MDVDTNPNRCFTTILYMVLFNPILNYWMQGNVIEKIKLILYGWCLDET